MTSKQTSRRLVRWTAGFAVAASVVGGPASAETLQQALSAAYKFNPRLDAARAAQRATDEEVPRALSGYRPSVTGTATTTYQNTRIVAPTGTATATAGELNPRTYSVGVVQPIFRGFRTINAVNGAEATVRAGRETLRLSEQSVLLEAVTAFGDVVRDQAIVKLRENNVTVLSRDLKATQDRFNVGEVTRTDVAQAQARRAASVSALDLAKANLQTSRATFERVVGHPPSSLVASGPSRMVPKALSEAIEIALRESPTVVGALYREQAARFAIETIRGELLPTVQLEANYGKSFDTSTVTSESEQTTVTGRLTVPFYTGGEVQARVRQAKHTHVQRLQEIEQNRTEQQAQVVQAWSNMMAARAQVESDQASVDANRIALTGVREEERVGQRTLLDVLNAEQELLNSEVNLATDRRNLLVASYSVLSSIGRLNAQELAVSESVYDSEQNYHVTRRKAFDTSITYHDGRREVIATEPVAPPPSKKTK